MQTISALLQNKQSIKKSNISSQWQLRAYEIWEGMKAPRSELGGLFRLFKFNYSKYSGLLEDSYSFTVDYEGNVPKIKLFYWKFHQLKKTIKS